MSSADWRNFMGTAQKEYEAKYSGTETTPAETPVDSKVAV
jgi:hypothetical protein